MKGAKSKPSDARLMIGTILFVLGQLTFSISCTYLVTFWLYGWPLYLWRIGIGWVLGVSSLLIASILFEEETMALFGGLLHRGLALASIIIMGYILKVHTHENPPPWRFAEGVLTLACLGIFLSCVWSGKRKSKRRDKAHRRPAVDPQ